MLHGTEFAKSVGLNRKRAILDQARFYVRAMTKESEVSGWIVKESARLSKILEKGSKLAGEKLDLIQVKRNILESFIVRKAEELVDSVHAEL